MYLKYLKIQKIWPLPVSVSYLRYIMKVSSPTLRFSKLTNDLWTGRVGFPIQPWHKTILLSTCLVFGIGLLPLSGFDAVVVPVALLYTCSTLCPKNADVRFGSPLNQPSNRIANPPSIIVTLNPNLRSLL